MLHALKLNLRNNDIKKYTDMKQVQNTIFYQNITIAKN